MSDVPWEKVVTYFHDEKSSKERRKVEMRMGSIIFSLRQNGIFCH